MTNEAKQIAEGLSEAQRRWMSGQGAGPKCIRRLIELGLIKPYSDRSYHVTDLGLKVRAILKGEQS